MKSDRADPRRTPPHGNCVEVAPAGRSARVRDSKNPAGPTVSLPDWQGFLDAAKRGLFNA